MSKMYDDLQKRPSSVPIPNSSEQLDLFSYAQRHAPRTQEAPPRLVESQPTPPTDATCTAVPSFFRRGLERNAPLAGVIEPLSKISPLGRRRLAWRRYVAVILGLIAVGFGALFAIRACRRSVREHAAAEFPLPAVAPEPAQTPSPVPSAATPNVVGASAPASRPSQALPQLALRQVATPEQTTPRSLPLLQLPKAQVITAGEVQIIIFQEGMFLGATRLKPEAARTLRALAKQLAPYGRRLNIAVIGCTDNEPISPGSRFRDNTELGLARAREVTNFLRESGPLPNAHFQVLSYGERWAPFPNDTPAHRAKNRTVVLRISVTH